MLSSMTDFFQISFYEQKLRLQVFNVASTPRLTGRSSRQVGRLTIYLNFSGKTNFYASLRQVDDVNIKLRSDLNSTLYVSLFFSSVLSSS